MVAGVDSRRPSQVLRADHLDPGPAQHHCGPRPRLRDAVLPASALLKERNQQSQAAEERSRQEEERRPVNIADEAFAERQRIRPGPERLHARAAPDSILGAACATSHGRSSPTRYTEPATTTSPGFSSLPGASASASASA